MNLINRPEHMGDIRPVVENPEKAVQPDVPDGFPLPAQNVPFIPSENNPFRPGDTVIYKYNQKGTVVSVNGDGVQVDFGLGVHFLSYMVLKLSQN